VPSTGAPQSAQRIVAAFLGTGAKAWLSTSITLILLLILSCVVCRVLSRDNEGAFVGEKGERRRVVTEFMSRGKCAA